MKRLLAITAAMTLAGGAAAQNKPANAPAANGPAANKPAANGPAASAPAGNAPAGSATPAGAAAPTAAKSLSVRVPSGGSYTAYIQEAPAAPKTISDKGELEIPSGAKSLTVYVLDQKSGYAARKAVDTGALPAELSFASPDFKLVQKVRVEVTGKDSKPIAQGIVTLKDGGNNTTRKVIQPASQGAVEFDFVASGSGSVTVAPEGGSATTKEVSLDLPKGEAVQSIVVALPEVTNTVEPAAGAAAPAANGPAGAAPATAPPSAAPPTVPAQTAPAQPAPMQPAAPSGGDPGSTIIGFIFLAALLFAGYMYMKNRGITFEDLMKKMGVQPDTVGPGGTSLAGANLATSAPSPGMAPPPPPVVADPNMCQFCGQMKDANGGCACTVVPGAAAGPAIGLRPSGPLSTGPRLVGMSGIYMGQVYPINGTITIGRDPAQPVPLDRDTSVSRRHAQITDEGGSYRIQDLGSSNGTFVNGARITELSLSPGDEVSIGGTRFRFEV